MWIYISEAYRVFGFVFNKMFGPRNSVTWSSVAKRVPAKCPWGEGPDKGSCPAGPSGLQSAYPAWVSVRPGHQLLRVHRHCSLLQLLAIHVTEQ